MPYDIPHMTYGKEERRSYVLCSHVITQHDL
jgi:hypothetical protein